MQASRVRCAGLAPALDPVGRCRAARRLSVNAKAFVGFVAVKGQRPLGHVVVGELRNRVVQRRFLERNMDDFGLVRVNPRRKGGWPPRTQRCGIPDRSREMGVSVATARR
jgi:hypothetical protein